MFKAVLPVRVCAVLFLSGLILCGAISAKGPEPSSGSFRILVLEIEAGISPAQDEVLEQALAQCREQDFQMLLIRLDTPGGLGTSMRNMVKSILNSSVPVGVWVGPGGARAASAGVFLVAASSVAAMSATATMGAATPVSLTGKKIDPVMAQKIKNDILSLARGIVQARGRNGDWYARAVDEAASLTGKEAVEMKVVEFLAENMDEFVVGLGRAGVSFGGGIVQIDPARVELVDYDPGLRHRLLSWLLDPQVAYLLLLGGMAGLFFELTTPGAVFPGVFGGLCLLLGLYAMSVLPTNVAGVLLILFGLVLFILEMKIASFGMLTVSGLVSIFVGTLVLFKTDYGLYRLPLGGIILTLALLGIFVTLCMWVVTRAQISRPASGVEAMVGLEAVVVAWDKGKGRVLVRGERWSARSVPEIGLESDDGQGMPDFKRDERVEVVGFDGLTLIVSRAGTTYSK